MYGIWDLFCCWFLVLLHYCTVKKNGLQHTRLPCPSQSSGICSNSCSLSQWGHPTISSSVVPFSSCPQSFQIPGSFPMSWVFASGGQSIRASALIPPHEYSGLISFRIIWFDLLAVQGTLKSLIQHHSLKASVLWCSAFFMVQLSHLYVATGKTIALTIQTHEAHLSMEFSSQEYWSGLHFLLWEIFLTRGWNPDLLDFLHWHAGSLPAEPPGKH